MISCKKPEHFVVLFVSRFDPRNCQFVWLVSLGCSDILLNFDNWIPKNQLPPHTRTRTCTHPLHAHTHHTDTRTHTPHTTHSHTHTHITHTRHSLTLTLTNTHITHTHTHTHTHTKRTTYTHIYTHHIIHTHTHHAHYIFENSAFFPTCLPCDCLIQTLIPTLHIIKDEHRVDRYFCLSDCSFFSPYHKAPPPG